METATFKVRRDEAVPPGSTQPKAFFTEIEFTACYKITPHVKASCISSIRIDALPAIIAFCPETKLGVFRYKETLEDGGRVSHDTEQKGTYDKKTTSKPILCPVCT